MMASVRAQPFRDRYEVQRHERMGMLLRQSFERLVCDLNGSCSDFGGKDRFKKDAKLHTSLLSTIPLCNSTIFPYCPILAHSL